MTAKQKIMTYMQNHPHAWYTANELIEAIPKSPAAIHFAIRDLLKTFAIVKKKDPRIVVYRRLIDFAAEYLDGPDIALLSIIRRHDSIFWDDVERHIRKNCYHLLRDDIDNVLFIRDWLAEHLSDYRISYLGQPGCPIQEEPDEMGVIIIKHLI